jgi:predicted dithiol-disulfide oxidoreductase (DUF899 family)
MDCHMSKEFNLPPVVSPAEWQAAHDAPLAKEKAATRARDALAAERRRQPMVKIDKSYVFEGPKAKLSLLNLFEGRRQLIIYHFMFGPGAPGWPEAGCHGCSMFVDQIGHLSHLTPATPPWPWSRSRRCQRSKPTGNVWCGRSPGFPRPEVTSTGISA